MSTADEQTAFLWLQGRMLDLLLRHDLSRFKNTFSERLGTLFDDTAHAALHPYRELAVLRYLHSDLFETIMPQIKRRLSFLAPREVDVEALPSRGRIDWNRTLATSMRDRPGEPPLTVHTRQRRRHFATPENLLTVATIIEFQAAVQRHLDSETERGGSRALRHPLHDMSDHCRRELAFPQFVGLVAPCKRIVAGSAATQLDDLEAAVAEELLPGQNSAYADLLTWRQRLAALRLLDRDTVTVSPMLGADPARDNYLYQIWLFYELAELLDGRGLLEHWDVAEMELCFRWGAADQQHYRLKHDRKLDQHWHNAPGVRPDFYLARADQVAIRDGDNLIWREPGYVLDAKYYKPRDSERAPASTVKRMLADLLLTGEQQGALLFAFQTGAPDQHTAGDSDTLADSDAHPGNTPLYRVAPGTAAQQVGRPDTTVDVWRLRPTMGSQTAIGATLAAVLDQAHAALRARVPVACHGVFLDSLSATEQQTLVGRDGTALDDKHSEIVVCPKPHIGPWRLDLVRRDRQCCQDAQVCHIIGQPDARKPVRPPRTADELLAELQQMFEREEQAFDALDSDAVSAIAQRVEAVTRRFAEISGVYRRIDEYYHRLRDLGLNETLGKLAQPEQESLALAIFLADQLDSIGAQDYSAPAIHLSSVVEIEVQRRVFGCPDLQSVAQHPKKQTLGTLPYMRRSPEKTEGDWERIVAYTDAHWRAQFDPDDQDHSVEFTNFVGKVIDPIAQLRNQAAHTHPLNRDEYSRLQRLVCQRSKLGPGALNILLLAWQ